MNEFALGYLTNESIPKWMKYRVCQAILPLIRSTREELLHDRTAKFYRAQGHEVQSTDKRNSDMGLQERVWFLLTKEDDKVKWMDIISPFFHDDFAMDKLREHYVKEDTRERPGYSEVREFFFMDFLKQLNSNDPSTKTSFDKIVSSARTRKSAQLQSEIGMLNAQNKYI